MFGMRTNRTVGQNSIFTDIIGRPCISGDNVGSRCRLKGQDGIEGLERNIRVSDDS